MQKKTVSCSVLCFVLMLCVAYVALPTKATYDATQPVTVQTFQSFFYSGFSVSVSRYDTYYATGQHYVSFDVSASSPDYRQQYDLYTDPYPYDWLFPSSTDPYNPPPYTIPPVPNPNPNATHPIWSNPNAPLITIFGSLPYYWWNGIAFVPSGTYNDFKGRSVWIKYDHPDNYQRYRLNPDGTPNANQGYTLTGTNGRYAQHLTVQEINDMIFNGNIGRLAMTIGGIVIGALISGIGWLLAIFMNIIGWVFSQWTDVVVKTELGDGWFYVWDLGRWDYWWLHSVWFSASFGAWRDWRWHFYLSNFGVNYVIPV
ncbi:MAG: hypothetical protein QXM22_01570 [Candidatus Bathyarchaeia archaeon]